MLAAGGEKLFEVDVPDDSDIEGDIAVGTFLLDVSPNLPGALLIEIADVDEEQRKPRWGYFLHLVDGEFIIDDHIPDFIADELEGEIRV